MKWSISLSSNSRKKYCPTKMQFIELLLFFALIGLVPAAENSGTSETVELNSPAGRVRGSLMTSLRGRKIYSFRGLKYAEAPIGELRFKPAVRAAPWKGVFDGTQEGPSCPQPMGQRQSEDCLHLNVWTTKLPSAVHPNNSENPNRPVIVFFHPGAFYYFSGQSAVQGPRYLMDQDVVLVTVNYRLGTLGFLATGDNQAPGNLALKDQVVALQWIQNNIASFGGNPNSVTIAGYSSGALSVMLHLISPMTKGLFHRAIIMSNYPIWNTRFPTNQNDLAKKQAEFVGCPTNSSAIIVACLKTKTAEEIAYSLPQFFDWRSYPTLLWMPVVEPEIPGVERYLPAQPEDLIRQGKIHRVPLITGFTKDEYASTVIPFVEEARNGNMTAFQELNNDWEKIAPIVLGYERGTPRSRRISKSLREAYLNKQSINLETVDNLADMFRDLYAFSGHRLVNLISQYTNNPVYLYEFTYQGRYSFGVWSDTKKPYGVGHHDDLQYIFDNGYLPFFEETAPEIRTVQRMTSLWANFAKTSKPIPSNNDLFANTTWAPFTQKNKKYLEMGDHFVMKTNFRAEKMNVWDRVFPIGAADRA